MDENNLADKFPEITKEWHPKKNGELKPQDLAAGSNRKVWWVCEKGHEWEAAVFSRTFRSSGCPYCSGRLVTPENNLAAKFAKMSAEWHPTKNGNLSPSHVTPGSHKKVWWKCGKGHEWLTTVANRAGGRGCPYCAGKKVAADNSLASYSNKLAQEWQPSKNGKLTPHDVTPGSHRKVWWVCEKGHEWEAVVSSRTRGSGCPYCAGMKVGDDNNLTVLEPKIAREWHPTKNCDVSASDVSPGSRKKVWWKCEKGHEWETGVWNRTVGMGCPYCSGRKVATDNNLAVDFPKLTEEWHATKNGSLVPTDVTSRSHKKVWWKCKKGHEWITTVANRSRGTDCPICSRKNAD